MATIRYCFLIAIKNTGNDDNANSNFVTDSEDKLISCSCLQIDSFVDRSMVKDL